MPEIAFKDKGQVFGDLYDSIFNDNITAGQLLVPFSIMSVISSKKRALQAAMRNGEAFDTRLSFLNSGAYHVLNVVAWLVRAYGLADEKLDSNGVAELVSEAIEVVAAAVEHTAAADEGFSVGRFFRNASSKASIRESFRGHQRDHGQSET